MGRQLCISLLSLALTLPATASFARTPSLWSEKPADSEALVTGNDFSRLATSVIPGVVSIAIEQEAKVSRHQMHQDPFDYFHRFFGVPGQSPHQRGRPQSPAKGIGTGFVIHPKGLILTNNHVVENASTIEVTLLNTDNSERTLKAKVLGTAPEYDVALIQTLEDANAPVIFLGDSAQMKIGNSVMAVGNPFGLSHSVSVGIISAKERRDIAPSGRHGLYNFIQTDASINPGNSGGPLINMRGEVIGINTAINSAGSGIGFAIPINMVKEILPQLKSKGKYTRSWIGIRIQELTDDLSETYGLKNTLGALVSEVIPEGPADAAGLKEGDIILKFDGKTVNNSTDLPLYASMAGVGKQVPVQAWSGGRRRTYTIKLSEFPDGRPPPAPPKGTEEKSAGIGITISDITRKLQRELQLSSQKGVLIREVQPGSVASHSGLQPGDIILRLNSQAIKSAKGFTRTLKKISSGGVLRLQVKRGPEGTRIFLAIRKP